MVWASTAASGENVGAFADHCAARKIRKLYHNIMALHTLSTAYATVR